MTQTSYKTEFPEFELKVQIPEGFTDCSYCHDENPSWSNKELGLTLYISNDSETEKYQLYKGEYPDLIEVLGTDDWNLIISSIIEFRLYISKN